MRWLVVVLATGCADAGPRLDGVTPEAAGRGQRVELAGTRLCGETHNCETAGGKVQLGINPPVVLAGVIEYEDTRALIEIPALADIGPTSILVTVNDQASNAIEFEVLP